MGGAGKNTRNRATPPFSLRLTFEERAALEAAAGSMPLGAYIRSQLLQDGHAPRRQRRRPVKDHAAIARVLGELGKSRIANNINQLARAVHTGSLPVTPDTEQAIREACKGIKEMRTMLMIALDFPASGGP